MNIYYPKPAILHHVPNEGHVIMEASAGTGKTYTLEHLVVELLLHNPEVELENVLVVTFTERATLELKVRVRKVIKHVLDAALHARRDPDSPYLSPPAGDTPYWTIDEEQRRKLERAHLSFDIAPIYTIHAFCQKILTEYAFANRRMFDQQHVDFHPLFERAFTDTMRRTLARDAELREWLEAWLEVGSVEELQGMMSQVLLSQAEIWPRFREDALLEGLERFGDELWELYRQIYRRRCDKREVAFAAAQKAWKEQRSLPRFLMHADAEVIDFKHSLREARVETPEQHDFLKFSVSLLRFKPAVAQKFLPVIHQALEREKRRTGAYTFDDMLGMLWESLSSNTSHSEWLANTLRRRYRFALIDEFQDTDEVQWKIFRKLFTQGEQRRERLFVIGDPKQAIYGFRGADVHTYIQACQELMQLELPANDDALIIGELEEAPTPAAPLAREPQEEVPGRVDPDEDVEIGNGAVKLRLRYNYRSTKALIDGYNTILEQRPVSPFFSGEEIRYDHPVKCGDPEREVRDARGELAAPIVVGVMKRREGEQHKSARMDDLYECYGAWIANEIKHLLSDEGALTFTKRGEPRRLTASDIFVLTRTRSDELKLEKHLRDARIPYLFARQDGLFDGPQAREVYEVLRAIERPRERSRRLRAWSTPFFAIDLEELTQCREVSETHPLYKSLIHWHVLAKEQRFEELFTDLLQRSGLVRRELFFAEDERILSDYAQLLDVLLEEAHLGRCDIHELVARTRAFIEKKRKPLGHDGDLKRIEEQGDAVQILTMHKSKGLEAPIVFLYPFGGMGGDSWRFHYTDRQGELVRALHIHKPEEKISPKLRDRVEQEDREESERLLYVAMTRAEARLYLPFIPYVGESPCCKSIAQRTYHVLNKYLKTLMDELELPPEEGAEAAHQRLHELFHRQEIPYFGMRSSHEPLEQDQIAALSRWKPRLSFLNEAREDRASVERERQLVHARQQHLESYSSLKRRAGGYQLAGAPMDEQELMADAELGSTPETVREDELPGGVRTGLFLHAMLEDLDYTTLTKYEDSEQWREDTRVKTLFERGLNEHGLEPRFLELAQRVVWRALTAVVQVQHGVIYGLGHCLPNLRELEFLYPIPEQGQRELEPQRFGSRVLVERGFLKGYIDYTFEWSNRVYFADWKSDVLERYDAASVRNHFEINYSKQAHLYAIALCKAFQIDSQEAYEARFGGAVYCFLRGMQEDSSAGLVSWRPSWRELCDFERAMTEPDLGQPSPALPQWLHASDSEAAS